MTLQHRITTLAQDIEDDRLLTLTPLHIRVVTLSFNESVNGFAEEPLKRACAQGNLLEVREHFYVHSGIPRLTLVLTFDDSRPAPSGRNTSAPDPGESLPEELRPLYKQLRQWRNERAKGDGVPSYVILRNAQLAEICRRQPISLAALKEIEGIGEATCAKYGQDLLSLLPARPSGEGQS